jgi:hypothetical protein
MTRSMKASFVSLLAICALTMSVFPALLAPTPFNGSGNGQIVTFVPTANGVEITATGTGVATHLGRFVRNEEILLNPTTGELTGSIVFTAANGDELWCTFSGGFTGPATAAGTYTITGGTGRFVGASGVAAFSIVQSDPANFSFAFDGSIDTQ